MSDGGDGFELHPGDPWHPGWTDDAVDKPDAKKKAKRSGEPQPPKKRWFSRNPPAPAPVPPREDVTEDVAFSEPLADPQARFRPAVPFVPEAVAPAPPPSTDPATAEPAPAPALELPSWVGDATQGAEVEAASFTAPPRAEAAVAPPVGAPPPEAPPPQVAPPAAVSPTPPPATPPDPTIEDDTAAVEIVAEAAPTEAELEDPFEQLRREEEAAAVQNAEVESAESAPPAAATRYGVASKEAFAVLGADDAADDLEDWAAFAGTPDEAPNRAASAPAAAPGGPPDVALPDEPIEARRRGVWPFRRKRRVETEPEFPEIEDVWPEEDVLGPGSWSPPDTRTPPAEPPPRLWDVETVEEPMIPDLAAAATEWDDAPTATTPVAARPEPEEPVEDLLPGAVPTIAALPSAGDPEWTGEIAATEDEEWRLDFDDGTAEEGFAPSYAARPGGSTGGDEDAWGSDADWDNEATVEMTDPGLRRPDDVYGMAGTVEHRGLAEEMFRLGEEDTEWQAMTAAMPGVESGVVGFEDVADLRTGEQYEEAPRSDLGARVGVGLLLTVFLVGTMFVGGAAMAVFIGAMALLGTWEFFGTLRRLEFQPLAMIGYLGSLGILAAVWFNGPVAIPIGLALLLVLVYFVYAFSPTRQDALANGGLTVLAVAWVAGCVAFATPILRQDDFRALVAALVVATVAMDIGAYSFGRTFGSRALAPLVSPNKSIEGLVGGVVVTIGAGVGFGLLVEPFDLTSGIALGAVVAVMAPLGDLAESMVKRSLGVKDMGTLLPGHGGVLDRIDGFLFVLPAVFVLYRITGFLG